MNKSRLCDGEDYVTTQNIGAGCFSPMHVYNRGSFIEEIELQEDGRLLRTCRTALRDPGRSLHGQRHAHVVMLNPATCAELGDIVSANVDRCGTTIRVLSHAQLPPG